jgi:hypothetical protein
MRIHLVLGLLLLFGAALCAAQEPGTMVFTAGRLAELLPLKQGELVEDDAADAGRVFQVKTPLNLEQYGDFGVLKPGLFRFTVRAKLTEPAPHGVTLTMACWNPHGSATSFRNEATITGDDFPAVGEYVNISRDFRIGVKGIQYGIFLRGGWPGLRIESFAIAAVSPAPVEIARVWPEKLLYRLDETGKVLVYLRNNTETPQTVRLVMAVESGLTQSVGLYNADVTVGVPTAEQRLRQTDVQTVAVPLPPQPEYGHRVTARLYPAGDKPQPPLGPEVADYFYTSNRPVQLGQYGGVNINEPYAATNLDIVQMHRRFYFPVLEFMFWAPCELSLLTPPPGTDRWWSGQTLKQLATAQMKAYIAAAHANGMQCVSYADYNIIYSYRIVDTFRRLPDSVGWDVNSSLLAYEVKNIDAQRRENDAERKTMEARGIYGPIASHPKLLKLHGDQLEAAIKALDWDGYRWDDPVDYDRPRTDIFGRQAPYTGYTNAGMIEYLRGRVRGRKPGAFFGHNMDWNQEEKPDPAKNVPPYYTEYLRDGSFALQEAETNFAVRNRWPWTRWAELTERAGRNAYRYGGEQYVIIDRNNSALEMNYLIGLLTAGGCHIAYGVPESCIPYMRLICRYSDLFYGDNRHFPDPDATLKVDDGGKLWWKRYVRYRATAPGRRTYYVHLFNPPTAERMNEPNPQPPAPAANVRLTWTLPAGWKATAAYAITADAPGAVEAVVNPTPTCTYTAFTLGRALERRPLALAGTAVTVPSVKQWSIVAVECTGPADAPEPNERLALPPAPPLPDLTAPVVAQKAPVKPLGTFQDRRYTAARFAGNKALATLVDDPAASAGTAARVIARGNIEFYEFPEGTMPAGLYRFALRLRVDKPLPEGAKLLVSAWSPNGSPKAFRVSAPLDVAGLTPEQGYKEFACELELGDARVQTGVQIANFTEGMVVDTFTIAQTQLYPDSKRMTWEPGNTWPETKPDPARPENAAGRRAWYGRGLFYEHYHLDEALGMMLGATMTHADHVVWRDRRGWDTAPFPKTPEELMGYDLVVIANVDLKTFSLLQRDWLRGYVRDGGKLLLLGGPYGFGRGFWQDSDILAELIPATLEPYDLRVVGEKTPVPLVPVTAWAKAATSWKSKPVTAWMHAVKPKPGATVHVTAAGLPALITAPYGKGAVALVTVAPLGDPPAGSTPFWKSADWTALMAGLGQVLMK